MTITRLFLVLATAASIGACGSVSESTADSAPACSSTETQCGTGCYDLNTSVEHCGDCATACSPGEVCSAGSCELFCSGGTTRCGDTCVDTALDPANCGGCGDEPNAGDHICALGEVCSAGACGLSCVGGTTKCGDRCVDTALDEGNCGGCADDPNPGDNLCTTDERCVSGACVANVPFYGLTGTPDPATVFNTSDVCFRYPNNLTNGIWHFASNLIIVGEFAQDGYWSHPANAGGHPSAPNNGTGGYRRLVHMPLTKRVAYTVSPSNDGIGPSPAADVRLASIDPFTGSLQPGVVAQFSDGYTGNCNVLSSSASELLCLENATTIRKYETSSDSPQLTFTGTVTLSQALPTIATCEGGHCYGGTFAWDGMYYYFARSQTSSANADYDVFSADGTFQSTQTAGGGVALNGLYFDWSVGRYAIHDGFGQRTGATNYNSLGSDSDSQCYGPVSTAHTLSF